MRAAPAPQPSATADPTFAVAFGGGGARGLAHIHVIEAMDELGIRPVALAGSSIGAMMGAGMAAGMSGREIHDYARSVLARRSEVAGRMWRARPETFAELLRGSLRIGQFDAERVMRAFMPPQVPATFAELKIPLQVTATDFFGHALVVYSEGELMSAIAASAAIPVLFRPVRRDGRLLIDGGIYNPVPFDLLEGLADIVIAIDVVGAPAELRRKRPSALDLVFGSSQLMMQSIMAAMLKQRRPDIFLRPPVSRFRVLEFMKIDAVMAETQGIKDELKRAIAEAVLRREARRRG